MNDRDSRDNFTLLFLIVSEIEGAFKLFNKTDSEN